MEAGTSSASIVLYSQVYPAHPNATRALMSRSPSSFLLALAAFALFAGAPTDAAAQARTDTQVIRSWEMPVKADGLTQTRRVEVAFDYARGVTLRRTYDAAGGLLRTETVDGQPQPSPAEIAEATAIIKADAELGALIDQTDATVEGGFVYSPEGFDRPLAACGPGARCLQFDLIGPAKLESVRFVVVDLATREVVERDLFPDL
jgi:hypothetical protein